MITHPAKLISLIVIFWVAVLVIAFGIFANFARAQTSEHTMVDTECFQMEWTLAQNATSHDLVGTYPDGSKVVFTDVLSPTEICIDQLYVPVIFEVIANAGNLENPSDPSKPVERMFWMDADGNDVIGVSDFGRFGAQFGWCKTGNIIVPPEECGE